MSLLIYFLSGLIPMKMQQISTYHHPLYYSKKLGFGRLRYCMSFCLAPM